MRTFYRGWRPVGVLIPITRTPPAWGVGEFLTPLIYTCSLPCNRRGARLKEIGHARKVPQNPGHAAAFREGSGSTQSKGFYTA